MKLYQSILPTLSSALLVASCQLPSSTEPVGTQEAATEPSASAAGDAAAETTPADPGEAASSGAAESGAATGEERSSNPDGVLLDYYRDDSRGNIQAMESRLKPLEVVHPDEQEQDGSDE